MTLNNSETTRKLGDRKIRAVAFDLDGLMVNTEDLYDEVLDALLKPHGYRFTRQLKLQVMGLPSTEAANSIIQRCNLSLDADSLMHDVHERLADLLPDRLEPLPGLLALLKQVEDAGLPKSVATSSSPTFANRALATIDLADRFEFVLTAEDVERGKPNPDIYLETARRHEVDAQNLLVLEDSLIGSRAGVAAGAITVAIPGHHSCEQDFSHVDYRFNRLDTPSLMGMIGRKSAVLDR